MSETKQIPTIAKFWRKLYQTVPAFNVPFTNLPISFALASAAVLMTVRITSDLVLRTVIGWPDESSQWAASSLTGITHSSLLCPGLVTAFLTHKYDPSEPLSKAPGWWQDLVNALLQFCTGYMVYDAIFIVLVRFDLSESWIPSLEADDYMYLAHHFMTSTYMTQSRVYQAGHMSALMCMLLGEATNPFMNGWFVTSKAITLDCCNGSVMQILHHYIEIAFAASYLFFRAVLGPLYFVPMSWSLLTSQNAKEHLPMWVRLFWTFMIWAVVLGSYSWMVTCAEMLQKHISGAEQEL